jgi:outer membrane protein TolC
MKLTDSHAALVKGMLARGDKQHDIAAFFGVNGGRIAEIKTGDRFPDVQPAPKRELPPASALTGGVAIYEARRALDRAQAGINAARAALDDFEAKLDIPGGRPNA